MDIQLVSSFSTTVSVLRQQQREGQGQQGATGLCSTDYQTQDPGSTSRAPAVLHPEATYLRSISLGFLATYWATRSLSRVRRMSVKYSSFP